MVAARGLPIEFSMAGSAPPAVARRCRERSARITREPVSWADGPAHRREMRTGAAEIVHRREVRADVGGRVMGLVLAGAVQAGDAAALPPTPRRLWWLSIPSARNKRSVR